ncbi:hypothetical protein [Aliivibrio fischeri]|uniref:hypothetical protein n=1 Tax=Aliivibrio fischeri TaxID=668 RepID=UPI0011126A40|nr:hypothetical protein [Aliivibrio fischeri]
MIRTILILALLSFPFTSMAQTDEASSSKPFVGVHVDTVEVELTSISEATNQLANAMVSMSTSIKLLSENGVNLSDDNQKKLTEMLTSSNELLKSAQGLVGRVPEATSDLPKISQSLKEMAQSLNSINSDVLSLLKEYPQFVVTTQDLIESSKGEAINVIREAISDTGWKTLCAFGLALVIALAIVLMIGLGFPLALYLSFCKISDIKVERAIKDTRT